METPNSNVQPAMFSAINAEKELSFVTTYDPKYTVAEGYRVAVIRYRDLGKPGVAAKPAKMVVVPQISIPAGILAVLAPDATDEQKQLSSKAATVLLGVLEDQQDTIIRQKIDENLSVINWSDLSPVKCFDDLTATRTNSRLTTEAIVNWVKAAMVARLTERGKQIAQEKGYNAEDTAKQIAKTTNSYAENYGKLAATVPNIGKETAETLDKFLKASELDDDIAKALRKKLHTILNPVAANNGDL